MLNEIMWTSKDLIEQYTDDLEYARMNVRDIAECGGTVSELEHWLDEQEKADCLIDLWKRCCAE